MQAVTPHSSIAWSALCVAASLTFVFLLAPIVIVVVTAFSDAELMSFPPQGLSLRWFAAFFQHADFMASLKLSLVLALLAAAASTGIGTTAALALARPFRGRPLAEAFLLAPLYVPRVLIGLALLLAYAWLNLSGSFAGLLAGHILITFPYTVRTVLVGLRGVEPALEEAARMLGASRWQVFRLVTLPLIRTAVLSGFVFALIISFSDIYLAIFVSGPQSTTLPLRLFTFMEWDQSPLVAAASTVQIVLILAVVLITARLFGLSAPGRTE
jgi:putative spermidine/putrescine transport system permease protein